MISLKNIDFKYDNSKELVLNNLSLDVEHGQRMAIIGASGCGKSTILRIIAGLESPQAGEVYINNKLMNGTPTEHRNIGFMFQEYALFPHMTVHQNIKYGLKKDDGKVKEIAEIVGIDELLERYPHELSGDA